MKKPAFSLIISAFFMFQCSLAWAQSSLLIGTWKLAEVKGIYTFRSEKDNFKKLRTQSFPNQFSKILTGSTNNTKATSPIAYGIYLYFNNPKRQGSGISFESVSSEHPIAVDFNPIFPSGVSNLPGAKSAVYNFQNIGDNHIFKMTYDILSLNPKTMGGMHSGTGGKESAQYMNAEVNANQLIITENLADMDSNLYH